MQGSDPGGEQPNRIQVVVRVRPVLPHEISDEVAVTCSPDARKLQVLLPDRLAGGGSVLPGATRTGARSYEFDACLPGSTSQEEMYEICGLQELVEAALDGYCVTIFAFGQTGSGKTHTIIGPRLSRGPAAISVSAAAGTGTLRLGSLGSTASATSGGAGGSSDDIVALPGSAASGRSSASANGSGPAGQSPGPGAGVLAGGGGTGLGGGRGGVLVDPEDGILTRCITAAYRSIEARSRSAEFSVTASVVELYNEAVTDLLALDKTKQLQVRKDSRDGFAVTGLTQVACPSDVAAVRYMVRALQYRHTRSHKLNEYSSRSHCLMTFVFASKEAGPDGQMGAKGGIRRYGKLVLVDLAGSERLKETGNTERGAVRETGSINKSLFTLGQVLAGLSARSCGSSTTFVPFRDSKLTQLLWDGLRGSGRCLMLACVGPMRSAAEESLNTLHFATMATRIKAEPVVLLDPQDQLVLDLRKMITQLRDENRQLAGALQQLSLGADPNAVLASLPDALRSQAATTSGTASPDMHTRRPGQLMPVTLSPHSGDDSGPSTPQRTPPPQQQQQYPHQPHHLLPLQGAAGGGGAPVRRSYDTVGAFGTGSPEGPPGSGGHGYGGGGEGGYAAPPPQPLAAAMVAAPQLLQRVNSGGLRASYNSSASGYSTAGPPPRAGAGMSVEVPSPSHGAPASSGARGKPRGNNNNNNNNNNSNIGGGGRTPSPLQSAYGLAPTRSPPSSNGPAQQGRKGGGSGGLSNKGSSPRDGGGSNRSRSVGRNGGRPTYLTEDPGALLFGYSSALQPSPPPQSGVAAGSANGTTLPALGPARGNSVAPPLPAMSEFPELAALEAEFQNVLVNGGGGGAGVAASRSALSGSGTGSGGGPGGAVEGPSGYGGGGRGDAGSGGVELGEVGVPKPDVRALKWADRNRWFGQDYDMTAFAYQVHDRLVDVEGVDPTSDLYYNEIERRVAETFPDKWARLMREQLPGGSGAAAAQGIRRGAPGSSDGRVPAGQLQPQQQQQVLGPMGAALRVHVKEPLFRTAVGGVGSNDSGSSSSAIAASLAAQARARQSGAYYDAGGGGGYEYGELQLSNGGATPQYDGQGSDPNTPPMSGVNPFNIGALHSVAPPKASRFAPVPGAGHGMVLVPAGADGHGRASGFEALSDPSAAERIQREYARQRAMVVEELRRAKEDAEAERQRILNRIQRAAGGNKWRT